MKVVPRLLVIAGLLSLASCSHNPASPTQTPDWLTSLIQQLEAEPVASPPAMIASYDFDGQTVYYLTPRCCDEWSTLFSEDGQILCHPDGGLTGRGDGQCPTFMARRANERIIWRDSRKR